jgi:hypothetical protein
MIILKLKPLNKRKRSLSANDKENENKKKTPIQADKPPKLGKLESQK